MTILNRQRRLVEAGRIRLGEKVESGNGTRPGRLEHWRLTSRDETKIRAAAGVYGGNPREWKDRPGEWELYTETGALEVYLIPGSFTQHYELWGKNADGPVQCLRRCDGVNEDLSDGPCLCDHDTRYQDAKDGKACRPTSRLSVILPGVPGIGSWLLVTRGENAADELAGMTELLHEVVTRGEVVPARLRIDKRRSVTDGETHVYNVPVLDLDVTPARVLAVIGQAIPEEQKQIEATADTLAIAESGAQPETFTPAPQPDLPTVSEAVGTEPKKNKTKMAPIGKKTAAPKPDNITPAEEAPAALTDPPEEMITNSQRRLLFAKAAEFGLSQDDVRAAVKAVTGQESTMIAAADLDYVLVELGEASIKKEQQA